jgi:hypothetical protein
MPDIQTTTETSQEWGAIAGALAAAQGAFKEVKQNRTVNVTTKAGQKYSFSYATLDSVLSATTAALASNGIAVVCTIVDNRLTVRLMHSSGQWIASSCSVPPPTNDLQGFGSILTYLRRYMICALLNVAAEYDDDGHSGAGNTAIPVDPMQPLWEALDTLGIGPGASTQVWCEKVLGRKIPSVSALSKADYDTLLAAAKCLKPKDTATASKPTGLATREQCEALNAALDVLKYGFPGPEVTDPKKLSEAKKLAKLGWANGMLKRSTPISSFAAMTNEEAVRMIAAAQAGEVPEVDPMPDWMGQEPEAKK